LKVAASIVNKNDGLGTLEFGNNDVTFAGSIFIYMEVDGSSSPSLPYGDQINVSGASQITIDNSGINKPTLVVKTLHGAPMADWSFDLMNAPNLVGTFATGHVIFNGFTPDNGYDVSYPAGPPRKVRITSLGGDAGDPPGGGGA
jgi:hypothetical protein